MTKMNRHLTNRSDCLPAVRPLAELSLQISLPTSPHHPSRVTKVGSDGGNGPLRPVAASLAAVPSSLELRKLRSGDKMSTRSSTARVMPIHFNCSPRLSLLTIPPV